MSGQSGTFRRLLPLAAQAQAAEDGQASLAGHKAARLAAAARAGLPVLPGWVVPCEAAGPALSAGAAAVSGGSPAAARRAVLSCPLDPDLGAELAGAVADLGGRVIVRSSSPLEGDQRWSGAFSSIAEVGEQDVTTAVRSCWAAAFAADPLARLRACGLFPEDLRLGVVIQPELSPDAGGTATVTPRDGDLEVTAEAVAGHPGPLLAGWAEGTSGPALAGLIGGRAAGQVAGLAARVFQVLGDDKIEWAIQNGSVWLLQSQASGDRHGVRATANAGPSELPQPSPMGWMPHPPPSPMGWMRHPQPSCGVDATSIPFPKGAGATATGGPLSRREWMPLLAAAVRERGQRLRARPAAPGVAAGRLVPCRPHERPGASCADAILLVDRPVPALAPLLFGARGLIARTGAAGSHLAEVARSLAVPMVTGCALPAGSTAALPGSSWLAAVDGTLGEVTLLPR